ncbi:hypothetical protein [Neorhodopirellula pilleata]|uniref:Uncharacterized protein n=1 Tax=Neorhodopirellula pilleata TaxID=2714738 RepID=A0A5C6ANU6_9BACT|nr:hypothetical protein [Neorhodopirellula pilleata]TWU01645.1 hypothetical protein Pla100_13800 [Neorhodopirellula pilleata]
MPAATDKSTTRKTKSTDKNVVTMDRRRDDRRGGGKDASSEKASTEPRRKTQRRRHIDPTTCERDYSEKEVEFMKAMDDYKQSSGRMFPTCSEVLEVIRSLGYVQLTDEQYASLGLTEDEEETADAYSDEEADDFAEV